VREDNFGLLSAQCLASPNERLGLQHSEFLQNESCLFKMVITLKFTLHESWSDLLDNRKHLYESDIFLHSPSEDLDTSNCKMSFPYLLSIKIVPFLYRGFPYVALFVSSDEATSVRSELVKDWKQHWNSDWKNVVLICVDRGQTHLTIWVPICLYGGYVEK
jgi:hypothetical protein